MKTYLQWALILALFFGCTKSDNGQPNEDDTHSNLETNYTVVLSNSSVSTTKDIIANSQVMLLTNNQSGYGTNKVSDHQFKNDQVLTTLSINNCLGTIVCHNFFDDSKISFNPFSNSNICDISVNSIAHSGKNVFIGYEYYNTNLGKTIHSLRIIDINAPNNHRDITIISKIKDLEFTNNNVYALLKNDDTTNSLLAIDQDTDEELLSLNLGSGALNITKNTDSNILISYESMHIILNSNTMITSETRYEEATSPKFSNSIIKNFDDQGKLYYAMPLNSGSSNNISDTPSVYDFNKNLIIMYYYENFLTQKQLTETYKIGKTTLVDYDTVNEMIVIGYQKYDDPNKGGLLRIKPVPNPEFIDYIELESVPKYIFIE